MKKLEEGGKKILKKIDWDYQSWVMRNGSTCGAAGRAHYGNYLDHL